MTTMTKSNTNFSRRSALAGFSLSAAAVGAASLPVAIASGASDPIFRLIDTHQTALTAVRAAYTEVHRLEHAMPDDAVHCEEPHFEAGEYKGTPLIVRSRDELELAFGMTGVERGLTIDDEDSEAWEKLRSDYREASIAFDEEVARCERGKAWRAEHGFYDAEAARERADIENDKAAALLLETAPTTLAGIAAMLEHFSQFDYEECWELPEAWELTLLSTVQRSIQGLMSMPTEAAECLFQNTAETVRHLAAVHEARS